MSGITVEDLTASKKIAEDEMNVAIKSILNDFTNATGVVPNGVRINFSICTKTDRSKIGSVFHNIEAIDCELHLELNL